MSRLHLFSAATLSCTLAAQVGQVPGSVLIPSAVSLYQTSSQPTLAQRLRTAAPEINKLIAEFKARDAESLAESILPAEVPAWDKSNPQTQVKSYQAYREVEYAFFLAGQAADAAGHWEKALEYFQKARDISKTNTGNVAETFPLIVDYYKGLVDRAKRTLEENADYIKELRGKANPDEGDKQQIEVAKNTEESIESNTKQAKLFSDYIESVKKEAAYYAGFADQEALINKDETEQLENYKFKNDKAKYVEGIMSAKSYLEQQFPEKAPRVRYLYRLNVMDPSNRKVVRAVEELAGVKLSIQEDKGSKHKTR